MKSASFDEVRQRIFGATFEFGRQLSGGQIKGLESYRIAKTKYNYTLHGDEYPVTDKVVAAFREFVAGDARFRVSEKVINDNMDYIQNRIREEMITMAYGLEAGEQIQLQSDPQLQKALESIQQARQLADNLYQGSAQKH